MYLVLGKENCGNCVLVKNLLEKNNIDFEYKLLSEIENKKEYIEKARKNGMMSMPLIIKENQFFTIDDLVSYIKTLNV